MPYVGEILPLSCQLLDGDDTKFLRAVLKEPDGTELAVSPVTMVNIGGGKYSSDTVPMPNLDYVEATYESFDDAGFTIENEDHLLGTDVFRLEVPDSVIVDKLDQILAKLYGLALPGAAIHATLVQNTIKEVINDVQTAKALVERDDIKAVIDQEQSAVAEVSDDEITATVKCES